MSFVCLYAHVVFTTKYREPSLNDEIRQRVFDHIGENARLKGIKIIAINGHVDHVNCLISIGKEKSIGEIMRLIKGESSHWINKMQLTSKKFSWQKDYWVESIYRDQIPLIIQYINKQKNHHGSDSFKKKMRTFFNETTS